VVQNRTKKSREKAEKSRTKKRRRKWYKSGAKVGQKTATIRTQREGERMSETLENFSFAAAYLSWLYAHDNRLKPQKRTATHNRQEMGYRSTEPNTIGAAFIIRH